MIRFLVELLPRLLESYEALLARIAPDGYHKGGFYASTLFTAPIGLHLWHKPIERWWKRIPVRLLGYVLLVFAVWIFIHGPWVFAFLSLLGRPAKYLAGKLGLDRSRRPPYVPSRLLFSMTRVDMAAVLFIGCIIVVFFLNRDQLTPKEDSDHNYHMAVARQILEKKTIPEWDDWEYAPAGRPHLYPPGLHILIAAFAGRPDRVEEGFQSLQVFMYPLAIFLTWWFTRWLFGARMGLLATLIFSMDMTAGFTLLGVLPSAMVTALMPLILMAFLTKRSKLTILLLTISFYTHLGVPYMIVFGLFLFSARHRGYYGFFKHVLTWSLLWFVPWFGRLVPVLGWFGTPSSAVFESGGRTLGSFASGIVLGFLSLQIINPIFLIIGLTRLRRFVHPATSFLRHILFGFLPMLVSYGGRFWMHSAPIWAVFLASFFIRWLPEGATRKRVVALILCTLIPLPLVTLGMPGHPGPRLLPNVGGAMFTVAYALSPAEEDTDFDDLAAFIRTHTAPREIVHVDEKKIYLGDRITTETGRRTDVGGWAAEVRDAEMLKTVEDYRKADTDCLFVYERREVPADRRCARVEKIGRFNVGIRGKTEPLDRQSHPPEPAREKGDSHSDVKSVGSGT